MYMYSTMYVSLFLFGFYFVFWGETLLQHRGSALPWLGWHTKIASSREVLKMPSGRVNFVLERQPAISSPGGWVCMQKKETIYVKLYISTLWAK